MSALPILDGGPRPLGPAACTAEAGFQPLPLALRRPTAVGGVGLGPASLDSLILTAGGLELSPPLEPLPSNAGRGLCALAPAWALAPPPPEGLGCFINGGGAGLLMPAPLGAARASGAPGATGH